MSKLILLISLLAFSCGKNNNHYYATYEQATEIIDPCGKETSHDEVILRLGDYSLVVFFDASSANNSDERLTILEEGKTYTTTDGTNCRFEIIEQNSMLIVNEL
jgi:hypothetical protein